MTTDQTGKLGHTSGHEDEASFLKDYRKAEYPKPSVTVDLLIFTVIDTDLKVLMIRRKGHPFQGCLALPGGFVDVGNSYDEQGESLDDAAARELGEEAFARTDDALEFVQGLLDRNNVHLEQLYTFGDPYRDPRMRVIDVAYYALVPTNLVPLIQAGDDAAEAGWHSVSEIDFAHLSFDHAKILRMGVERIRGKIDYSPIAFSLLPPTFTVTELREVHEAIKGKTYDKGNFRRRFKRMQTDGIIQDAPGKRTSGVRGGKPAKVYRFIDGDRAADLYA
jgi:8-oxo-dGTP diphosphatase